MLEGIGILEKKSKNNIQWKCGSDTLGMPGDAGTSKQYELDMLEQKENHLDELIRTIRDEINAQFQNTAHAYITNNDLKSIDIFKDQTVIVVKAPPEAKLMVSDRLSLSQLPVFSSGGLKPYGILQLPDAKLPREIHFKADKGEIDVFLCPDDTYQPPCDPLLDDIRPYVTPIVEKYLSPQKGNGKSASQSLLRLQSLTAFSAATVSGKPSTYPLRTAQRNLSKILLGASDNTDDTESIDSSDKTISTPKQYRELDNLIDNILNPVPSTSSYASSINDKDASTATAATRSSSMHIVNEIAGDRSNNNPSALKNDVKLNQFNEYGECYQHTQPQNGAAYVASANSMHGHQAAGATQLEVNSAIMNNNNNSTNDGKQHGKGVRNALISEMVDYNSLNNIITQHDSSAAGKSCSLISAHSILCTANRSLIMRQMLITCLLTTKKLNEKRRGARERDRAPRGFFPKWKLDGEDLPARSLTTHAPIAGISRRDLWQ